VPIIAPVSIEQITRFATRLWGVATRRRQPDHHALGERQQRVVSPGMVRFYFYGAVAPAWSVVREPDEGQVGRARAVAADLLPDLFPDAPAAADASGTTFRRTNSTDCMDDVVLRVQPSGLVELSWSLVPEFDQSGRLLLSALDIAWLAARIGWVAQQESYMELSRLTTQRKRKRALDWFFAVTPSVSTPNGQRSWDGLRFPGEEPPRAAHKWATVPVVGYGGGLVESAGVVSPDRVASIVLTEHLQANGYHDYRTAVEEAVKAVNDRPEAPQYAGALEEFAGPKPKWLSTPCLLPPVTGGGTLRGRFLSSYEVKGQFTGDWHVGSLRCNERPVSWTAARR
jgi:hypothetical protein